MKKLVASILFSALAAMTAGTSTGCSPKHASFVKVNDVTLGRVVIYRNGVAYYERRATVTGGFLTISVPRDRVDDFLKSLTVIDARTNQPLPVAIPRDPGGDSTTLVMKLQMPSADVADVVLTYVTESPSWKPSYRVVVGDKGKVMLEGWAIVDNTSGEDWNNVLVGVGSSSALSFRYDLWSVRQVQRETLAPDERIAIAPPTGGSPYAATAAGERDEEVVADLSDVEIRRPPGHPDDKASERMLEAGAAADEMATGSKSRRAVPQKSAPRPESGSQPSAAAPRYDQGDAKLGVINDDLVRGNKIIVIESSGNANESGADGRARDRANIVRNRLIDRGVDPGRIEVVTRVEAGTADHVRVVAKAPPPGSETSPGGVIDETPVGESHFASTQPMTVAAGASAMVAMVRAETPGEIVYLYDAESARGNDRFAFRAVRLQNPTNSTLETGPVTVYGDERFIGEGLTEAIPPKAAVVVPFALDKQIVIDRNTGDENRISRLVTLERGVLTAEVQHIRRTKLTVSSRLHEATRVYIRHTVGKGWDLIEAPSTAERVGDAMLFVVDLEAGQQKEVEIAEATPMERTLDLSADVTLDMMKVFVDAPEPSAALKAALSRILTMHREAVDLVAERDSLRRRLADYRERMDELHTQLVTLQLVKTGGDLMKHLRGKMADISDRVQQATIALVDNEEKIMLTRVRFQDDLADLHLPDVAQPGQPGEPGGGSNPTAKSAPSR